MAFAERLPVNPPPICVPPVPRQKKPTASKSALDPIRVGTATLLWHERRFPAEIIEASADGFVFVVKREPRMNLGDHAALADATTVTRIEIVSKTALEAQGQAARRPRHRFSARRLWDEAANDGAESAEGILASWLQRSQSPLGAASNTLLAVAFLAATALALIVSLSGSWSFDGRGTHRSDDAIDSTLHSPANPLATKAKAATEQPSAFWGWMAGGKTAAGAGGRQVERVAGAAGGAISTATGTTAVVVRSLADALGTVKLTFQQEMAVQQVGKITDAALTAMTDDGETSAAEIAQRRDRLLQAARQEVLRLLSAEQRAALEKGPASP